MKRCAFWAWDGGRGCEGVMGRGGERSLGRAFREKDCTH